MGVDPVHVKLRDLQSFNRYSYANNNPNKYCDPDGREIRLQTHPVNLGLGFKHAKVTIIPANQKKYANQLAGGILRCQHSGGSVDETETHANGEGSSFFRSDMVLIQSAFAGGWTSDVQITAINQQPAAGTGSELVFIETNLTSNPSGCGYGTGFYFTVADERMKRISYGAGAPCLNVRRSSLRNSGVSS